MAETAQPLHVLFVCVENACRSQMAEAFARHHGQGRVVPFSAGSRPRGQVDRETIAVMQERGFDLSRHASKGLDGLPKVAWDAIVTMGCGDACPHLPAKRRVDWQVPNPSGRPPAEFRRIRDSIESSIKALIHELTA